MNDTPSTHTPDSEIPDPRDLVKSTPLPEPPEPSAPRALQGLSDLVTPPLAIAPDREMVNKVRAGEHPRNPDEVCLDLIYDDPDDGDRTVSRVTMSKATAHFLWRLFGRAVGYETAAGVALRNLDTMRQLLNDREDAPSAVPAALIVLDEVEQFVHQQHIPPSER
jgi:hypothetical protein